MSAKRRHRALRTRFVLFVLTLLAASFTQSQNSQVPDSKPSTPDPVPEHTAPPPRSAYAGDKTCAECHRKQADTYALTPHALDSAPADAKHILGSFSPGHNVFHTSNPNLIVAMTTEHGDFYQSGINISDPKNPTGQVEKFDISVGSGRHAQTYLYWDHDQLYQLPVSYWRWTNEWVLSPGFPAGQIHFDRPIVPRCLECHASYFQWLNPPANRFAKDSIVLGIECERCHGPGAEHVARERTAKPPATGSAELAIINPARLTRDRQLDLCSLCHAGAVEPIGAPLRFIAGDNVRNYLIIPPPSADAPVDVHGNQVGALEQSKCFGSGKLTCSTCHDVHRIQEAAGAFSSRCLTCHQVSTCGEYKKLGAVIRTHCIDCHMPQHESAQITSAAGDRKLHALLRVHRIAIYAEDSKSIEAKLKDMRPKAASPTAK